MQGNSAQLATRNSKHVTIPNKNTQKFHRPNAKQMMEGYKMTELLFQTDSYLRKFSAEVLETDSAENAVILDRTAFYPGGGGQPNDTGFLHAGDKTYRVSKVKKQDGRILHYIEGELPAAGTEVEGQLDWENRYKLMRTHTAMHILCGAVWRDYDAQVTGGNMEPLAGRMDFEFESLEAALIKEIEEKVNQEVKAAREVRVKILPREEAFQIPDLIRTKINLLPEGISHVRTVEITGLDLQADGGTHVANTKEVGAMKIVEYKSKGKINKRIYVELYD
ncbi:MAG TPA: alanyl-tRNA editing protein [Clostridia bacterium]|nr:alanyl-tRNA editing protein [Clostridia bacterium]